MTIYMLGHGSSELYETTTAVGLAELSNFTFIKGLKFLKAPSKGSILIRYGISKYPEKDKLFSVVLNTSDAIRKASQKLDACLLFQKKKIPTPKVFLSRESVTKADLPVLRRKRYHTRGKDIKLICSMKEMVDGDYYTKFIKGKDEYRVHVFNGEAIRIQKKVREKGTEKEYIHNYENGFLLLDTYEHNIKLEASLLKIAVDSVKACGLLFGAVDILIEDKTKKPFVLEVNSAPRLCKYGRQLYLIYIYTYLKMPCDPKMFTRVKKNSGSKSNGLPIKYREILTS